MEQLSLHIEYLLLRHDCVIVPGFGAFINVRESAKVDRKSGLILPMKREVRFNGALTHDDGLLASSFARREGVSFSEGRELLRRETASLTDILSVDGESTLGRLGTMHRDSEGNVSFRPFRSAAASVRDLGYLPAPMLERESSVNMTAEEEPATSPSGEKKGGRRFDTGRNYYIAVNKVFARTAACLVLTIGIALSLILPDFGSGKEDKASVMPVEDIVRTACMKIAEPARELPESVPANRSAEATPERHPYHLIVATFRTESEAGEYISQHSASGYRLEAIGSKTKWRVSAKSGATSAELQNTLNDKTFKEEYGDCWIWEDKEAR